MERALDIHFGLLAGFYLLLIIPLFLFSRWQLGLNRTLLESVLRMTIQLILVGLYLQVLFDSQSWLFNLLWLLVMLVVASFTICRRAGLALKLAVPASLLGLCVALAVVLPAMLAGVIQSSPWWQAQYLIPVAGMLLGNSLGANVLALERWYSGLKERQQEYQFYLAMGAPRPAQGFIRQAVKAALAPHLSSMATLGIVSLPGMMTGQILGGTPPMLAVKYQLAIMVAIFMAVVLSTCCCLALVSRIAFDEYGQLRF